MRIVLLALVACALNVASADARTFREDFKGAGDRAFAGATWWDQDAWDVRSDTYSAAVTPDDESAKWRGQYSAVIKGRGVMHLDFQGISSARLRNPLQISQKRPGVVSFRAPLFVTMGHWWEVAITPTRQPTPGEYTAVPSRQHPEGLNNPVTGLDDDGSTNGPGHRASVEDAINVISTGFPDGPTCDRYGWRARWALTSSRNGQVTDHITKKPRIEALYKVNPRKRTQLVPWRIEFERDRVTLFGDRNLDGRMERVDRWRVAVPWPQVYVQLLDVAYQAGHHPPANCGLGEFGITQAQSTAWQDVRVSPVAYGRTVALPQAKFARKAGWMSYDLRDVSAHVGPGAPNAATYDRYTSYLACSVGGNGGLPCPDRVANRLKLRTMIAAKDLKGLERAQLLADVRFPGTVGVTINGKRVGTLPRAVRRPDVVGKEGFGDAFEELAWLRRGIDIPKGVLGPGMNTVVLTLDQKTNVEIDRIQLELALR